MTDDLISKLSKLLLLRDGQSGSVSNLTVTEEQIETVIAPVAQEIFSKFGQTALRILIRELESCGQGALTEGDDKSNIIDSISLKSPEARHGEQDAKFSPWHRWEERSDFADMDKRGVYIIATFGDKPGESPSPTLLNVIYIGETHGEKMNFKKRLRLFHRSAQSGEGKHAGGRTYFQKSFDPSFSGVYFTVIPCELADMKVNSAWIFHLERKLIWEYVSKHGELPKCNSE